MAKLATVTGDRITWKGNSGVSTLPRMGMSEHHFPTAGFYVKSQRTGQVRLFLCDNATNEENEFFDGEAMAFFCPGDDLRLVIWCGE